jgi:hypothetical protein
MNHLPNSSPIATDDWVRRGIRPTRAAPQLRQPQFHCGNPPPAAVPNRRTRILASRRPLRRPLVRFDVGSALATNPHNVYFGFLPLLLALSIFHSHRKSALSSPSFPPESSPPRPQSLFARLTLFERKNANVAASVCGLAFMRFGRPRCPKPGFTNLFSSALSGSQPLSPPEPPFPLTPHYSALLWHSALRTTFDVPWLPKPLIFAHDLAEQIRATLC